MLSFPTVTESNSQRSTRRKVESMKRTAQEQYYNLNPAGEYCIQTIGIPGNPPLWTVTQEGTDSNVKLYFNTEKEAKNYVEEKNLTLLNKCTAAIQKQSFDVVPSSWHVDQAVGGIALIKSQEAAFEEDEV